jgi:hypothetical protein
VENMGEYLIHLGGLVVIHPENSFLELRIEELLYSLLSL